MLADKNTARDACPGHTTDAINTICPPQAGTPDNARSCPFTIKMIGGCGGDPKYFQNVKAGAVVSRLDVWSDADDFSIISAIKVTLT